MAFLAPAALLGLGLIVPVLLLYMLRLRRREVAVSSTFLWQQVLRDHEANTPWQRLRRSLLLFIQLLILIVIVLALARPYLTVPGISTARTAILIDASLSMTATDAADGTRLAEAQRRARELIAALTAGAEASIIRVGDAVDVLAPFTPDRAALTAAVDALTPGFGGADWTTALTLANAGAAGAASYAIVILSDGGAFAPAAGTLPGLAGELRYLRVGASGENVAVSALAVSALPGQPPQLFARLTNYGAQPAAVIFDLRVDGELFAAERVTVEPGASVPYTSSALPDDFTTVQAGITRPAGSPVPDHLAADDAAFAVAPVTATRRVLLVTAGNLFLEQGLRALPGVDVFVSPPPDTGIVPAGTFDLYAFDGWLPAALPTADLLIVHPPGDTALFTVAPPITADGDPAALSVPRLIRDPATASTGIDLALVETAGVSNLSLRAFTPVTAPGLDPVLAVEGGAIVQAGTIGGRQIAVFGFDLHDSDLPLQIAYPALLAALIDWYAPADALRVAPAVLTGDPLRVTPLSGAAAIRVTGPDGAIGSVPVTGATLDAGTAAQPGIYRLDALTADGGVIASAWTAASPYRPAESDLLPRAIVRVGEAEIGGAALEQTGQQELWPWLAVLALILIALEWLIYHRRQGTRAAFRPLTRRTG